ncbi:YCF48-related protein [Algoriphagus halophilus]|uniref:Por secretion system C-terminal sorting domain-containing protein n=1 Tax=Algoriphagus halophilus TaxID=226505 RepID=A0A1N6FXN8_9BACT|nr:YCF48-related protein [Algoriphagus halophilus]SIN99961.1 Por secretion system C-terminal sorting domain-containing protein [Algoriphagus halophilus]
MRKAFYLLIVCLFIGNSLFGQSWKRMQSWGLDLEDITWINNLVGYAGGENLLIKTVDGGLTWEEQLIPTTTRINDLEFWDEQIGIAVGDIGELLITRDGGLIWNSLAGPSPVDLNGVSFINENTLLIIGESGTIYRSEDMGNSWQQITSSVSANLNDLYFIDENLGFVTGDVGIILKTINGGTSFEKLTTSVNTQLNAITFSNETTGYAVGSEGTIIKTEDGGSSWNLLNSGLTNELKDIGFSPLNPNIIVIIGSEATAIKSINAGATFSKANLGSGNLRNLNALEFIPESNVLLAVGENGYVISSGNAGSNYSTKLAGYRNDFSSIDFKSERVGYIAGTQGTVYLTTNGATSIINRSLPETTDILSISFWNNGFGYVSSNTGKIFRTSNSGSSWVPVPANTPEDITGFYLFAPSVLYVTGTNGYIARSFNSGGTWDSEIVTNTNENLKDVTYFDFQVGFAMGENGQISWTNGGNTWENLPKLREQHLNALAKVDSSTAVIVGDGGIILKSEDMAKTWRIIPSDITENLNSIDFWDENIGIIAGDNGLTLQTKDGGETWLQIETGTSRNLNSVSMGTSLVAFAAGDDGTILNYTCSTPPGISEIKGATSVCLGNSTYQVDDQAISGSQIVWRVDGGEIISGQGTSQVEVKWSKTGRQGLFVSRQNFCGNGETSALEVEVLTTPIIDLEIEGLGSVCTNQSEVYSVPLEQGVTYTWTIEGGEILSGQNSSEIEVLWKNVGPNTLSVVLENSCGGTAPITKTIIIGAPPEQPSIIVGEQLVGLGEASYTIELQEGVDYRWEISGNGGIILSGQGSSSIIVDWQLEGDFMLTVTPQNNCNEGEARDLEVTVNIITGIEPKPDPSLSFYPNPSQGSLTITSDNLSVYQEVSVLNTLGKELIHSEIQEGQREIYFTDLPRGLALIRLRNHSKTVVKKIIVR